MNKKLFSWRSVMISGLTPCVLIGMMFICAVQIKAQLDPTFGTGGIRQLTDTIDRLTMAVYGLPDGKILVVSNRYPSQNFDLIRLNADGSNDATYGSGGVVSLPYVFQAGQFDIKGIYAAARQPDGKIVFVGTDISQALIARFNENGTLDTSFGGTGIVRKTPVPGDLNPLRSVLILPDGKILAGGEAFNTHRQFFLRFNSDGSDDNTFGNQGLVDNGDLNGGPYILAQQSTGKIIARIGASNTGRIRRFNADGTVDNTFTTTNNPRISVAVQADDKIVVSYYTATSETYGRTNNDSFVTRLNADGTLDTGFGTGGTVNLIWARYMNEMPIALRILPKGGILVAAGTDILPSMNRIKGNTAAFAKLSSDGTVTGRFLVGGAFTPGLDENVAVMPNGKIVFGGGTYVSSGTPNFRQQISQISGVPMESYKFRAVPFDMKSSYNGFTDRVVFRPSNLRWYPGEVFGELTDIRVPADYLDKGYDSEFAIFRPSTGIWQISPHSNGLPVNLVTVNWGMEGDIPVPADYDGDEKADITVWRPSTGVWYVRRSIDGVMNALQWGMTGDKPVPGDYDGDGLEDFAVFRPSNGVWYLYKTTEGMSFIYFGLNGDIPVQGDYDGDGKTDIAIWRPSNGAWYIMNSGNGTWSAMTWGLSDDKVVPGDYDGDGKFDITVWRPSTALWYVFQSSNQTMSVSSWGLSTDLPVGAKN